MLIKFSFSSKFQYRNQLSLQQDARLHLQREALQQRQAELRSVDQRILELQSRLQKKKASNLLLQTQPPLIHQQQNNIINNSITLQMLSNGNPNAPLKYVFRIFVLLNNAYFKKKL